MKNLFTQIKEKFRHRGSDIASHILSEVHNPTPKSKLFTYRFFDKETRLYHMDDHVVGFTLQGNPIVGCEDRLYKQISLLFDDQLPLNGVLEVLLVASNDLKEQLKKWKSARIVKNDILKKLEDYRSDFFETFNDDRHDNLRVRDYKLYFSFSLKCPKAQDMQSVVEFREKLKAILLSINIINQEILPEKFLRLVKELVNYPYFDQVQYRENDLLSDQLIDLANPLLVTDKEILLCGGKYSVRCYEVDSYPERFSISGMPELLGDSTQDNMQIPSMFAISYVVSNELGESAQESYKQKGDIVVQQARGMLSKFNKVLQEEGKEWNEIIQNNLKRKESFVRRSFIVLLLNEVSQINKAEQNLISLWKKNDFTLKPLKYFQLPGLLGFCPFMNQGEIKKLKRKFGLFRTVMSSEPKALLPIHGEWKGSNSGGMLFVGKKGQLHTWDPFEGASNPHVIIFGESGSGKSVFAQEYVLNQLSKGAKVFVIDIGRSFEKTCSIVGGDFINFGSNSNISLNPFSHIPTDTIVKLSDEREEDIPDVGNYSLSALKQIIAKMAAPIAGTTDIQNAAIAEAIHEVWQKYGAEANIDRLVGVLQQKGVRGADLGLMLFEFTSRGSYGKFFNREANIKFDNAFTVLEFDELREKPDIGGAIMQMLSIQIVQQVYLSDRSQKFVIMFDEGWYALKSFPEMLSSMVKTLRKYNGALALGTQSLNDFFETNRGGTKGNADRLNVIQNSAWKVFLKQTSFPEELAKEIKLSSDQVRLICNLETVPGKYSEALISKSEQEYFVVRLMLDKFASILYSSTPAIFSKINMYINQGIATADAIERVMREVA